MDNNRNMIIAIGLSIAVLLGWQYFVIGPRVEQEKAQTAQEEQLAAADADLAQSGTAAEGSGADSDMARPPSIEDGGAVSASGSSAPAGLTRQAALERSPRIEIDTPSVGGSIALKGARLDDLKLHNFHVTVDEDSPDVVLLSPAGSPAPYFSEFGWLAGGGANVALPNRDTVWSVEGNGKLTPDTPVTLAWNNGEGLTFRRQISVDDKYLFTVKDTVENTTGDAVTLFPYGLVSRSNLPEHKAFFILHEGFVGVFGDDGLEEINYDTIAEDGPTSLKANRGWLGMTDKYWATALIPEDGVEYTGRFSEDPDPRRTVYQADYRLPAVTVPANGSESVTNKLFAGAKVVSVVEGYEDQGVYKFDLLIDWGWFYFLTKPVFFALDWIAKLVGNFGVAILLLTVVIKLIFFPLANRSYEAMSKMKALQPEMEKLRERYKDDKMKQQQELMELYRKEKINPLAGCWPVLIQIPVFFALYKVLFVTIEMRHAPFFGWIQDLSAPDPTTIFNLFGLIPWDPPSFLMIGAWPLIMGFTMFVQMRMNPLPADPIQQTVFTWMPVIFTFFLASFPAGLVIYWAWNNFLSVLQQGVIMRRNNVKIELFGNLGLDKLLGRKSSDSDNA